MSTILESSWVNPASEWLAALQGREKVAEVMPGELRMAGREWAILKQSDMDPVHVNM